MRPPGVGGHQPPPGAKPSGRPSTISPGWTRTGAGSRAESGIETRRAGALVLVGHPALHADVPEEEVAETPRTCDAHVARGEALACKERVANAERSLAAGGEPA